MDFYASAVSVPEVCCALHCMQRSDAAKEQVAIEEPLKRLAVMVGGSCVSAWSVLYCALHATELCSQGASRN
jgi:hypothetical protein